MNTIRDEGDLLTSPGLRDWISSSRSYMIAWGLPAMLLVGGAFLIDLSVRTVIWAISLAWMGVACLMNAARCGRMHCYFTGPFFLFMAVAVLLHGFQVIWLGTDGWKWLGVMIVAGAAVLWWGPESIWGKFARRLKSKTHQ